MRKIISAAAAASLACALGAAPAAAECNDQPNRFPSFESVAPTAKDIVIATVTELTSDLPSDAAWFTVQVDEQLRGDGPESFEVQRLKSGLPLTGEDGCRENAVVYAGLGDVIALALDGELDGHQHVNAVAWVEGSPAGITFPHAETITAQRVRTLAAILPPTSTVDAAPMDEGRSPWVSPAGLILGALAAAGFIWRLRKRLVA